MRGASEICRFVGEGTASSGGEKTAAGFIPEEFKASRCVGTGLGICVNVISVPASEMPFSRMTNNACCAQHRRLI